LPVDALPIPSFVRLTVDATKSTELSITSYIPPPSLRAQYTCSELLKSLYVQHEPNADPGFDPEFNLYVLGVSEYLISSTYPECEIPTMYRCFDPAADKSACNAAMSANPAPPAKLSDTPFSLVSISALVESVIPALLTPVTLLYPDNPSGRLILYSGEPIIPFAPATDAPPLM
jgi:hypothetical protein